MQLYGVSKLQNLYFPNVPFTWAKHAPKNATFRKRPNSENSNCRNNSVNVTLLKAFNLIKEAKFCKSARGSADYRKAETRVSFSSCTMPLNCFQYQTILFWHSWHFHWWTQVIWSEWDLCATRARTTRLQSSDLWKRPGAGSATRPASTMPVPFPPSCCSLCKPFCSSSIR